MNKVDFAVGTAVVTLPLWYESLTFGLEFAALFGGVTLVGIRIALALREWFNKDNKKDH
jgi:hypothetical protein